MDYYLKKKYYYRFLQKYTLLANKLIKFKLFRTQFNCEMT